MHFSTYLQNVTIKEQLLRWSLNERKLNYILFLHIQTIGYQYVNNQSLERASKNNGPRAFARGAARY